MKRNDKSLLRIFRRFVPEKEGFRNPVAMKSNIIVALLLVMSVAPAYAAPADYSARTTSYSACSGSNLAAEASYNIYSNGAWFFTPPIQDRFIATQDGSTDTTGELTSCWDKASVACYPDTTVCPGCPIMSANSSATSNLATGLLHASGYGFAQYAGSRSDAILTDTLHFTIAGATSATVTPITVKWKVNAGWVGHDPTTDAGWVVQCKSYFRFAGNADIIIYGGTGAPVTVTESTSGWASYNYASLTTSTVDFTGVYNLVGPSVTLPFYHGLEAWAYGGGSGIYSIFNPFATTVECYDASPVELILPANVSFTSASGVFLLANSSALMAKLPSGVENFYNKVLDAYYGAISSGSVTWLLKQQDFPESLDIDKDLNITLKGGYNSTFGTNSGNYSTLQGITVGVGSLIVENIRII